MKECKLRELVTAACSVDRDISNLKDKLQEMKDDLIHEAQSRPDEHVATDGGGWSWTCEGVDGNVCRVTTPGDALKPSVDGEGRTIEKIREAAGVHFSRLFQQAPKWKPVPNFRDEATALLGKAYPQLDSSLIEERLAQLMFAAELLGRVSAADETRS